MPIQPVHQPPYMGKSDQSACKGQSRQHACREAAAYSSKAITHSEAPEQTALWVAKLGSACQNLQTPCPGHWRYVPRPCIVAVTQIDRWADFEGGNDEFETN